MIHLADSISFMRMLPADHVDCIVTDPPYKVVSGGIKPENDNGYANSIVKGIRTGKLFTYGHVPASLWMPEFYRILKPGSHCYVMTNRINMRDMLNLADEVGFHLHNILRWDKPNVNTGRWYMIDCEFTLLLAKRPVRPINNPGSKQGFKARVELPKWHPTQKPVALMEHYVTNSTKPGELVFDPFAGVGSTLIAAARNGRRWLGCEIDPLYHNVALVRMAGL